MGTDMFVQGTEQNIRGGELICLKLDKTPRDTFPALSFTIKVKLDFSKRSSNTSNLQLNTCKPEEKFVEPNSHGICDPMTAETFEMEEEYDNEGEPRLCKMSLENTFIGTWYAMPPCLATART